MPRTHGCGRVTQTKCTCKARPILDEDGNYSLALLEGHDAEWHFDVLTGIEWEELSYKMDEEEPQAALDISVAFNKKNEAAMKIGQRAKATRGGEGLSSSDWSCNYTSQAGKPNTNWRASSSSSSNKGDYS